MNITKEQADKVIAALKDAQHTCQNSIEFGALVEALTIMRGLEDAAPVCNHEWFQTGAMLSNEKRCIQCGEWGKLYTSPQVAQTEAALSEVVRLSEDAGLYDADFQTEAQEREAFEAWASNDGAWTRAIERDGADYKLMQTSSNWRAWKAARARAGSKP